MAIHKAEAERLGSFGRAEVCACRQSRCGAGTPSRGEAEPSVITLRARVVFDAVVTLTFAEASRSTSASILPAKVDASEHGSACPGGVPPLLVSRDIRYALPGF